MHLLAGHVVRVSTAIAIAAALVGCKCDEGAPAPGHAARSTSGRSGLPPLGQRVVRRAHLAGSWYPADPSELRGSVERFVSVVPPASGDRAGASDVVALVVPHAGHRFSGPTAGYAWGRLRGRSVSRVFLLGTDHHGGIRGIGLPTSTHFGTPLGEVAVDVTAVRALAKRSLFELHEDAFGEEHSIEIQLPFLRVVAPGARLVPMLVGRLTLEEIGRAARTLRERLRPGDVLVAASDFTHYGPQYRYVPFPADQAKVRLEEMARAAWEPLLAGNLRRFWNHKYETGDTICGFYPLSLLLGVLDGRVKGTLEHFDTSGNVTDSYQNSVSYVAATFAGPGALARLTASPDGCAQDVACPPAGSLSRQEQRTALTLARDAAQLYVDRRRELTDASRYGLTDRLRAPGAVFVTLNEDGRLRGCIGSIRATRPLWRDIVQNAGRAAVHDPRFPPVKSEELKELEIEISVLTAPTEVAGPDDILVGRDGITLEKEGRRAVFLPQVPIEQGWDLPTTLAHLSRKAGLPADAWRSGTRFSTFRAFVFSEAQL